MSVLCRKHPGSPAVDLPAWLSASLAGQQQQHQHRCHSCVRPRLSVEAVVDYTVCSLLPHMLQCKLAAGSNSNARKGMCWGTSPHPCAYQSLHHLVLDLHLQYTSLPQAAPAALRRLCAGHLKLNFFPVKRPVMCSLSTSSVRQALGNLASS